MDKINMNTIKIGDHTNAKNFEVLHSYKIFEKKIIKSSFLYYNGRRIGDCFYKNIKIDENLIRHNTDKKVVEGN